MLLPEPLAPMMVTISPPAHGEVQAVKDFDPPVAGSDLAEVRARLLLALVGQHPGRRPRILTMIMSSATSPSWLVSE